MSSSKHQTDTAGRNRSQQEVIDLLEEHGELTLLEILRKADSRMPIVQQAITNLTGEGGPVVEQEPERHGAPFRYALEESQS